METVVQEPVAELNLLTQWGDPDEPERRRRAVIGTVVFHIIAVAVILALPKDWFQPTPIEEPPERHITPIYMPLTPLTQKAPNNAKLTKEFRDADVGPRPQPKAKPSPPPAPQPVRQASIPAPPPPRPTQPPPPQIEPPQVNNSANLPKVDLPQNGLPMPPAPKSSSTTPLENLGAPAPVVPPDQRKLTMPDTSIAGALRGGNDHSLPPAPQVSGLGAQQENLPALLTDAQGVDFTPYLRQIRQIVERNWKQLIPQSVRMGGRGTTSIVFSIERIGSVGRLVVVRPSGTESYDLAAVSSISASQPFPPLPSAFKGPEIRIQFNFAYNAPKQQ